MSFGDMIRNLIDPDKQPNRIEPVVASWLRRELPRLMAAGVIEGWQANAIGRRYGIGPVWDPQASTSPLSPEAASVQPVPAAEVALDESAGEAAAGAQADLPVAEPMPEPPGPAWAAPTTPPQDTRPWTADPRAAGLLGPPPRPEAAPAEPVPALAPSAAPARGVAPPPRSVSPFFADHAISIVLYLGAFLIVTSVAIFLAYSWGDIEGGAKLGLLILINLAFLGVAALCLRYPAVRLAGRTFLAIGALLVPANVAAAYILVFEKGPVPVAVFWLLGAVLSGGLHAVLSWRLGSRAYGVLATLAVPIAADALLWLITPNPGWLGPPAALALAATLTSTRLRPATPLAQSARFVSAALLPLAALIALPTVDGTDRTALAAPIALLVSGAGLGWEATRRGWTWWCGAASTLVLMLFVSLAIAGARAGNLPLFVAGIVVSCWIPMAVARRLEGRQALLWDVAALVPALIYPAFALGSDNACAALLANAALLASAQAYVRRTAIPVYAAVLAVDALYIKLLAIFGDPSSPYWKLGTALWPLAIVWTALALTMPRALIGPFSLGALLTFLGAAALTAGQAGWCAAIACTAALGTIALAWRVRMGPILLAAAPWLMLGFYQIAVNLDLEISYRLAVTGLGGWVLLALSLARPAATVAEAPATPEAEPATASAADTADDAIAAANDSDETVSASVARPAATLPAYNPLEADWAECARLGAAGVTGLAALIVSAFVESVNTDHWLLATLLAWIDLSLLLAVWAWSTRSRDIGAVAALALVPALIAGIARQRPADVQAYALPIGLYLLAVSAVVRRDRRPNRDFFAVVIGAFGLLVLLGAGLGQTLDSEHPVDATWTLVEGLVLVLGGIAARWRLLLFGGIAGVVTGALVVSSLPIHNDPWLIATMLAWIDVGLVLGAWAWSARSRDIGGVAALSLVPALMAGIGRLHPADTQAYAVPIGLYLLAVAAVMRRDPRPDRAVIARAIATAGLIIMFGTGLMQSFDRDWLPHVVWTLAEGLVLSVVGIAVRWRVLVIGSIVGVGVIALRQIIDPMMFVDDDRDLAAMLAWLDLALMLGLWARSLRSRDVGLLSALGVVPALLAGIARLHPTDAQAYALPIGLYLLATALVVRRDARPGRLVIATAIAAIGLLAMLGSGVVQAIDRGWIGYTILTLVEGLGLAAIGIALRWRVLVVGGVAGVVFIAVRQLFDAVSALPGWAILGGSGLLLLATALVLLVARARLAAASRAAAERWSTWD